MGKKQQKTAEKQQCQAVGGTNKWPKNTGSIRRVPLNFWVTLYTQLPRGQSGPNTLATDASPLGTKRTGTILPLLVLNPNFAPFFYSQGYLGTN